MRSLIPLALMGAIFLLSAQPGGDPLAWWEVLLRKLGHFGGYAALALLWSWALAPAMRRPLPWALAIAVLYGVSDEYHQTLVEGRRGTALDVSIDALGAVAGTLFARWLALRRLRGSDPAVLGRHQHGLGAIERS